MLELSFLLKGTLVPLLCKQLGELAYVEEDTDMYIYLLLVFSASITVP